MSTFTTVSKQRLSWPAKEIELSSQAYNLLIDDTHFLDIGGGFQLVITPENAPTNWETVSRDRHSWPASPVDTTDRLFEIAEGYYLDIGDGFNLLAGTGERAPSEWTNINKTR